MNALIKSTFLGGLIVAGLTLSPMQANAIGFRHSPDSVGKVLSKAEFYETLKTIKSDEVAKVFGIPDQMLTLKKPDGELQGVVWVYRNAVKYGEGKLADARLVLIDGKLAYFALSGDN